MLYQDAVGKEADALKSVNRSFDDVENHIADAEAAVIRITETVDIVDHSKVSVLDAVSDLSGISEENAASAESSIIDWICCAEELDCSASFCISPATTANPLPASPLHTWTTPLEAAHKQ